MNLFTVRSGYALRALAEIALWHEAGHPGPLAVEQISRRQAVPRKFLEQILVSLKRAGLVRARRGQAGGYTLAQAPEEIRLLDVLSALESAPGPSRERQESPPTPAARAVRETFGEIEESLRSSLEQRTLAALVKNIQRPSGRAMYYI